MFEYKVVESCYEIIDNPTSSEYNTRDSEWIQIELDEYGAKGWELIQVIPFIFNSGLPYEPMVKKYRYIFKRLKQK